MASYEKLKNKECSFCFRRAEYSFKIQNGKTEYIYVCKLHFVCGCGAEAVDRYRGEFKCRRCLTVSFIPEPQYPNRRSALAGATEN